MILAPAKTLKKLSPPDILKMNAHFNMMLAASPFLPWSLKVEIKRMYENADHALALPQFFCQTVNPISTKVDWTPNLMF